MMVMGCCSRWGNRGAAARSLRAVHAGVAAAVCRELTAVHRLTWGRGRTMNRSCGRARLVAEFPQGVVAAFEEFAGDRQARAFVAEAGGGLEVVVAVG
jgi:hypothetical protein